MDKDILTITPVEPSPLALAMKEQRDKFLTETMGECWHEWNNVICKKCLMPAWSPIEDARERMPTDFSTWQGFGKLWEWTQKQEWWYKFHKYLHPEFSLIDNACWHEYHIHPERFADAIYKYLKETSNG